MIRFTQRIWIGRERRGEAGERRAEDRQDRADVRGQLEPHELDDVVVDRAAVVHRGDDGGEVVVGEDEARSLLGHLGAATAHGHADVGVLERRRVVDAVAGHGDHLATLAQHPHEQHLVLGGDPGEHTDVVDAGRELLLGHPIEVGTCDARRPRCRDRPRWRPP